MKARGVEIERVKGKRSEREREETTKRSNLLTNRSIQAREKAFERQSLSFPARTRTRSLSLSPRERQQPLPISLFSSLGSAPRPKREREMEAPKPDNDAAATNEEEGLESEVFVPYVPSIPIPNARQHPADIAESASLS